MSYVGRKLRERRVFLRDGRGVLIVPVDHGLTLGPITGMQSTHDFAGWIRSKHISAVLGHKGLVERLIMRDMLDPATGIIVHLNGMPTLAPAADTKVMLASVESALQLGADAVSIQVNFRQDNFAHNLAMLGAVTDAAHAAGLPVLTMLYDKVQSPSPAERLDRLHHLVRAAAELGSDAVKLAFPQSQHESESILSRHGQDIHILFAGGDKMPEDLLVSTTRASILHGARGLCIGRNVFQHPRPTILLERLARCMGSASERVAADLNLV
jgi:fructose-bisphosphate aldolase, class I